MTVFWKNKQIVPVTPTSSPLRTEGYEVRERNGKLRVVVSPLMTELLQKPVTESPKKITVGEDGSCLICRGTMCKSNYNTMFISNGFVVSINRNPRTFNY